MNKAQFRGFDESAPEYRRVRAGLNLSGKCKNEKCEAFNKEVWIIKGMGEFDIEKESQTSLCPACKIIVPDADNAGFYNCFYDVDG